MGESVRKFRESQGLSEQELADRIEVKKQTVVNWEEKKTAPTKKNLEKMSGMGLKIHTLSPQERQAIVNAWENDMKKGKRVSRAAILERAKNLENE